jgi:hypothetical protein
MGRGGLESYSETTLDSVFSMHHAGLAQEFAAAEKVIQAEIDNEFVSEAFTHPPFVPTRCNPRNVLIQTRTRIVPGSQQVEEYPKPRVLTDESHRASAKGRGAPTNEPTLHDTLPPIPPSSNEGVPNERRSLPLPSAVGFAKVTGIVNQACRCAGLRAEGYTVDASNAYTSLVRQRLDWWLGVFVWVDGLRFAYRTTFGGASAPQGFSRVMAVTRNAIRLEVGQFMATQPQLPAREAWSQRRRALQADGSLPPEREHAQPRNVRSFIDDVNGVASDRTVRIPPHLRRITFDPALTSAVGGTPCADDSETAVHARIAIWTLERLDFTIAVEKTMAGDVIISLGLRAVIRDDRVDCPELKRLSLIAAAAAFVKAITDGNPIDVALLERFTGRVCNLSHIYPAVLLWIHSAYSVFKVRSRNGGLQIKLVRLRPSGDRALEILRLLGTVEELAAANDGIPSVCSVQFPSTHDSGSVLQVTDASGNDGAGGYIFHANVPDTVFIVHVEWPPMVRAALAAATRPRVIRDRDTARQDMLSVPAAELATAWLVPYMVQRYTGLGFDNITAVGDCRPVACALLAACSPSPQTHHLLRLAYSLCHRWSAVAVKRERNTSADLLTHPASAADVVEQAKAAGLEVVEVARQSADVPDEVWELILQATRLLMGGERELVTVRHRRLPPDLATAVPITRPLPLSNPFSALESGRLVEAWRDACCDAYEWAFQAAVRGEVGCLHEIATLHGLPLGSVRGGFATSGWSAFTEGIRDATGQLLNRARDGEQLCLTCVCHPRRCHGATIVAWTMASIA